MNGRKSNATESQCCIGRQKPFRQIDSAVAVSYATGIKGIVIKIDVGLAYVPIYITACFGTVFSIAESADGNRYNGYSYYDCYDNACNLYDAINSFGDEFAEEHIARYNS